jgi:hypothetical protein
LNALNALQKLQGVKRKSCAPSAAAAAAHLLTGELEGSEHIEDAEWQPQYVAEVHVWVLGQGAVQQPGGTVGYNAQERQRVQFL